jgi:predicted small secreted protein
MTVAGADVTKISICERKEIVMIRKMLLALVLGSIAIGTSACNTVKGLGRDIQSVGDAGDRAM